MTTYVNSVQKVSITIGSGATSNTATISAVGSSAFIVYQGETVNNNGSTSSFAFQLGRIELTDSTTVTAFRNTSNSSTITVNAIIIDATSSLVSSVQNGTVSISGTTGTTTITSVDTTRSAVFYLGATTATTSSSAQHLPGVTLTDATTVTADVTASSGSSVGFCVVEFQSAVIQSVQQFTAAYTSSSTTDTQTISSIDPNNAFIAWGGGLVGSSSYANGTYAIEITDATTVTLTKNTTSSTTRSPYYSVVEFVSGVLNSAVQRGTIDMGGTTSNTATITSVDTSVSFITLPGWENSASNTIPGRYFNLLDFTNATTLTATVFAGNSTGLVPYEVIEFSGGAPPPAGTFVFIGGFL